MGCQMLTYVFIDRGVDKKSSEKNSKAQLETIRAGMVASAGQSSPLVLVVFPEGRDLNPRSIQASNDYADKQGLPRYKHVLHPKTAGLTQIFQGLSDASVQPLLLEATLAYVDHKKHEIPDWQNTLFLGRPMREVHIRLQCRELPEQPDLESSCKSIFREMEERLDLWSGAETAEARQAILSKFLGFELAEPPVDALRECCGSQVCIVLVLFSLTVAMHKVIQLVGALRFCGAMAVNCLLWHVVTSRGGFDTFARWHAQRWPHVAKCKRR